mmetsp:Transcript_36846/g.83387  ORF Transcript_36846/g.83387 Transcript_36846/m.83387 type:complete len:177 (-) Transcript_36846:24-554(-)|eukprot:CAMPEP_0181214178 /NCGR_PEP_ID=MMETSP1096-20121128/25310_1 /TAXON_ID=156174 ORGANISM="Chrysochromulina ericina, Strain CCMP281" /NCGR_SAMPLE_ID=MMETSP1096 /ASSEMBLY_ACC=CAM_ASM_000453 /LENGTH=176 /DNA_ID=CAMNT_0023305887 /DNA_START=32 /DNA_END=562 /DNA_ORIENTATION=-
MTYRVKFEVANPGLPSGDAEFEIEVHPEWAPLGEKRFKELVEAGYFTDCRVHRAVPGFIVQWGIPSDPQLYLKYGENKIKDDPVKVTNRKGTLSFATSGPNARGSQMFINLDDNASLDGQGFAPFAEVVTPGPAAFTFFEGYDRNGPDQTKAKQMGNAYLAKDFPKLSYFKKATIL